MKTLKERQQENRKKLNNILDKHLPEKEHEDIKQDIRDFFQNLKENLKGGKHAAKTETKVN